MKLINGIFKRLYWPLCRAYARYFVGDLPADAMYRFLCSLQFWRMHLYWPHFKNPISFSEKIFYRMLFDRNPQWTIISDKLLVRDYVAKKLSAEYLIPMLWYGDMPEKIPFDELPLKFVIKPNHGFGSVIMVKDKTQLDLKSTRLQLQKWLGKNFCQDTFLGIEWAYKNIRPMIIVESFLEDNGHIPEDYKFFCYSGRAEFVQVTYDRCGDASERILDRDFNPLALYNGFKIYSGKIVRPQNYEDMVRVAESLARGFDFIRVDLYSVGNQIYFGELTTLPASGRARFVPKKYDFVFGEKWKLE